MAIKSKILRGRVNLHASINHKLSNISKLIRKSEEIGPEEHNQPKVGPQNPESAMQNDQVFYECLHEEVCFHIHHYKTHNCGQC